MVNSAPRHRQNSPLGNTRGSLLITVLLAFAGLMCVNIAIQGAGIGDFVQTWPQAEGKILTASTGEVSFGLPRKKRKVPRVTYSFETAGKSYKGSKVLLSDASYENVTEDSGLVRVVFRDIEDKKVEMTFAAGDPVTVYHNPERPEEAVLHPYVPAGLRSFWILGIVMIVLAVVIGLREIFSG